MDIPAELEAVRARGSSIEAAADPRHGRSGEGQPHRLTRLPGRARLSCDACPNACLAPGPSFLREQPVRIGDRTLPGRDGPAVRTRPTAGGWRSCGSTDDDGVVSFRDVAPDAGPPPDPPLGAARARRSAARCPGLILEDAGRLQMRLGQIAPPDDPDPTVAHRRWRSARPSASSPPGPRRCAPTSWPRPSSSAFGRAVEGLHRP